MKSPSEIILEILCPLLGSIMANIMFAAPFKSVKAAKEAGRLGDLNPTPWAVMTGNTIGWVTYAILKENYYIFFGNAPGLLLSVWFNVQAIKLQYENQKSDQMAAFLKQHWDEEQQSNDKVKNIDNVITKAYDQVTTPTESHEQFLIFLITLWLGVISIITLGQDILSQDTREIIVGIIVNLNLVFFYGAPLSTILKVWQTRSSASIHPGTMITNTLNGTFWCAYGIAVLDYFVAVPNGLGALLGGIQIVLCVIFPRKPVEVSPDQDEAHSESETKGTLEHQESK